MILEPVRSYAHLDTQRRQLEINPDAWPELTVADCG